MLANRLSANDKYRVLLLEAGRPDKNPWLHLPIGYAKTMHHPLDNWCFYTEPNANLKDRKIYMPRSRTLGGSSSINGLVYIRGQKADYDHWAQLGNEGWSWDSCLPYFRKLERNDQGESETRGSAGPVWASTVPAGDKLVDSFIAAGAANGVPVTHDFNSGDQEGVGYLHLSTKRGLRCSKAASYLKQARGRENLTVVTGARTLLGSCSTAARPKRSSFAERDGCVSDHDCRESGRNDAHFADRNFNSPEDKVQNYYIVGSLIA